MCFTIKGHMQNTHARRPELHAVHWATNVCAYKMLSAHADDCACCRCHCRHQVDADVGRAQLMQAGIHGAHS